MSKTTKKWTIIGAVALVAIVIIDVLWNGWAVIGRFDYTLRQGFWVVAAVVLPAIIGLAIDHRRWKGGNSRDQSTYRKKLAAIIGGVVALLIASPALLDKLVARVQSGL